MKIDVSAEMSKKLAGLPLSEIERSEHCWFFMFSPNMSVGTEGPWRILVSKTIALTSEDDGQKFGLSAPVNAVDCARKLVGQSLVDGVTLRDGTGDLSIHFSGDVMLEFLNMSAGYEGWQFNDGEMRVITLGGGELALMGFQTQ